MQSLVQGAAVLATHRRSSSIDVRDVQTHLGNYPTPQLLFATCLKPKVGYAKFLFYLQVNGFFRTNSECLGSWLWIRRIDRKSVV